MEHKILVMKAWKTAVFLLLAIVALGLVLRLKSPSTLGPLRPDGQARRPASESTLTPVDLTAFYDNDSSFEAPGCWQAVPRGLQTLGNVPFRIEGLIQLWGEGPEGIGRHYRERVDGIPVTGKFQTLYALNGTSFTSANGTLIAEIVFRYADGSSATNAIR